ncbi:MAG: DUF1992 domain-containing protein [Deltaproteobacteria bacterium]|nr:DUF1992 domain-containing protein [Deltaproteobacteria bacterium]
MFTGFEKIVEDRIRKAQKMGAFENLEGYGKPLRFDDDQMIAEDLRLAYKILKNADFTPPEIEVRKKIEATEQLLSGMKDTAEKYRTLKKLNMLIMKLNMLRQSRVDMDMPQKYENKLVNRFASKPEQTSSK